MPTTLKISQKNHSSGDFAELFPRPLRLLLMPFLSSLKNSIATSPLQQYVPLEFYYFISPFQFFCGSLFPSPLSLSRLSFSFSSPFLSFFLLLSLSLSLSLSSSHLALSYFSAYRRWIPSWRSPHASTSTEASPLPLSLAIFGRLFELKYLLEPMQCRQRPLLSFWVPLLWALHSSVFVSPHL